MPHNKTFAFKAIIGLFLVGNAWIASISPAAPFVVGIEFVETPYYSAVMTAAPIENIFPFEFTDPNHSFSEHGALDGFTESQVRQGIVDAIQASFRDAEIGIPGQMLNVDIRMGAIDSTLGTVHSIGSFIGPIPLFGQAYPSGATFRPDLQPTNSVYTNQLSVTLADTVERIPELAPGVRFEHFDQVVHAVAGTAAHEIAHTLDVLNHVNYDENLEFQPLMASGASSLPIAERLNRRRFVDIPNTQHEFPGPLPFGDLIYSVPERLLATAGTTFVSDFNFDGLVDVHDFSIWNAHKFTEGTGVKTGDANGDGATDVHDFNVWNSQKSFDSTTETPPAELAIYREGNAFRMSHVNGETVQVNSISIKLSNEIDDIRWSDNHLAVGKMGDELQMLVDLELSGGDDVPLVHLSGLGSLGWVNAVIGLSDGTLITVPEPDSLRFSWGALVLGWGLRRKRV